MARKEILLKFIRMSFLVNIDLGHTPSKLIDNAIVTKPIICIIIGSISKKNVLPFLSRDYSKRYIIESPERYKIKNVCSEFIILIILI